MLRLLRAAAVAFSLSLTGPAWCATSAEPTPAQIRAAAEAFDLGREAYQREDYVKAAEQFERADSQAPSATALEYAMRAREKASQLDRAATLAAVATDRHPNESNLLKLAKGLLDRARRDLHEVRVRCDEPCELAVGGKIVHGGPSLSRALFIPPGTATLRAGFGGERSVSRDIKAARGTSSEAAFEPPEPVAAPVPEAPAPVVVSSPPEPPRPAPSGLPPSVFWIGAGLTLAATGATVWSGLDTLENPGEELVRNECLKDDTSCALYQDGLDRQRRTNVLIGVSAALGVGTIVVGTFFTDWSGGAESAQGKSQPAKRRRVGRIQWEPLVQVGEGALLGARGRF